MMVPEPQWVWMMVPEPQWVWMMGLAQVEVERCRCLKLEKQQELQAAPSLRLLQPRFQGRDRHSRGNLVQWVSNCQGFDRLRSQGWDLLLEPWRRCWWAWGAGCADTPHPWLSSRGRQSPGVSYVSCTTVAGFHTPTFLHHHRTSSRCE